MWPGGMREAIRRPLPCKGARRARSLSSSLGFLTLAQSSCHNLGPELFLYPSWGPPHRPAHAARPHLQDRIFRHPSRFYRFFLSFSRMAKIIKKSTPQKITFFSNFADFWALLRQLFGVFCDFGALPGVIYGFIFPISCSLTFCTIFKVFFENLKNEEVRLDQ